MSDPTHFLKSKKQKAPKLSRPKADPRVVSAMVGPGRSVPFTAVGIEITTPAHPIVASQGGDDVG